MSRRLSRHGPPDRRLRSDPSGAQVGTIQGRAISPLLAQRTPICPLSLAAIATPGVN